MSPEPSAPLVGHSEHTLTKREKAALAVFNCEGELNEGWIAEYCWPTIRNVRLVTNSLLRKGMVTLGMWDEDVGYELLPTIAGLEVIDTLPGGSHAC